MWSAWRLHWRLSNRQTAPASERNFTIASHCSAQKKKNHQRNCIPRRLLNAYCGFQVPTSLWPASFWVLPVLKEKAILKLFIRFFLQPKAACDCKRPVALRRRPQKQEKEMTNSVCLSCLCGLDYRPLGR